VRLAIADAASDLVCAACCVCHRFQVRHAAVDCATIFPVRSQCPIEERETQIADMQHFDPDNVPLDVKMAVNHVILVIAMWRDEEVDLTLRTG
jgi:hypothetical protein